MWNLLYKFAVLYSTESSFLTIDFKPNNATPDETECVVGILIDRKFTQYKLLN